MVVIRKAILQYFTLLLRKRKFECTCTNGTRV